MKEVMYFSESKKLCIVYKKMNGFQIKYFNVDSSQSIHQLQIPTQNNNSNISKSNNISMISLFSPNPIKKFDKYFQFTFFSLQKKSKAPTKLFVEKCGLLARYNDVFAEQIIQAGYYKFILLFRMDKQLGIFHYDAINKNFTRIQLKINTYSLLYRVDCFSNKIMRIVVSPLQNPIVSVEKPLFEDKQQYKIMKEINARTRSMKQINLDKNCTLIVYYVDIQTKILAASEVLNLSRAQFIKFNDQFYEEVIFRNKGQLIVKNHRIERNQSLAMIQLLLEMMGQSTDEDLIFKVLVLLDLQQS